MKVLSADNSSKITTLFQICSNYVDSASKCIKMSTVKPSIGLAVPEIALQISRKSKRFLGVIA